MFAERGESSEDSGGDCPIELNNSVDVGFDDIVRNMASNLQEAEEMKAKGPPPLR